MSVYTRQVNILMERLPEIEQQFIVEFIKKISRNNKFSDTDTLNLELINRKQIETIKNIMETLNAVETIADDELDGILTQGITFRSAEELDLL
ncbi:MAG: hypothetical protein FWD23_03545 [Oscillospiraceae bacterium]|nr:hypothetical protein [Oscillospiraceae bacterium]